MPIFEGVAAQQNPGAVAFPTAGTYEMVAQQEEATARCRTGDVAAQPFELLPLMGTTVSLSDFTLS